MIIKRIEDFNLVIACIYNILICLNIRIKKTKLLEMFVLSQCVDSMSELLASTPFYVEKCKANKIFNELLKNEINSNIKYRYLPHLLESAINSSLKYPLVTQSAFYIEISIEWGSGAISEPYIVHESQLRTIADNCIG